MVSRQCPPQLNATYMLTTMPDMFTTIESDVAGVLNNWAATLMKPMSNNMSNNIKQHYVGCTKGGLRRGVNASGWGSKGVWG